MKVVRAQQGKSAMMKCPKGIKRRNETYYQLRSSLHCTSYPVFDYSSLYSPSSRSPGTDLCKSYVHPCPCNLVTRIYSSALDFVLNATPAGVVVLLLVQLRALRYLQHQSLIWRKRWQPTKSAYDYEHLQMSRLGEEAMSGPFDHSRWLVGTCSRTRTDKGMGSLG